MSKTYGYCRVSTKQQSIERQEKNIKASFPEAVLRSEKYTGTKLEGRKELDRILKAVKPGDTIVFDSVSRMSRNAAEGVALYQDLFDKGVNLIFLKERHIDTAVYREALNRQMDVSVSTGDKSTDKLVNSILEALRQFQMDLAKRQIELAFQQSEKEVMDLRQRTKEGMAASDKSAGIEKGRHLTTKKSVIVKEQIRKLSKDFDGSNTDIEVMKIVGVARNTYYKYKKELANEIQ